MLMKFQNNFVRENYDVHTVMPGRLLSVNILFSGVRLGHFYEVSSILKANGSFNHTRALSGKCRSHRSLLGRRNICYCTSFYWK